MKRVQLLPVGDVDVALLRELRSDISRCFHASCDILTNTLDPAPAYHPERQQYHSSEILQRMQSLAGPPGGRLLGVAGIDLYIPILKYIFGEAQVGGPCALISSYRLRQEFYGLAPDEELLLQRLTKEAVHELGHTLGLRHCQDYRCAMASAHAVEWIDIRENELCEACRTQALWNCGELSRDSLRLTRPP